MPPEINGWVQETSFLVSCNVEIRHLFQATTTVLAKSMSLAILNLPRLVPIAGLPWHEFHVVICFVRHSLRNGMTIVVKLLSAPTRCKHSWSGVNSGN